MSQEYESIDKASTRQPLRIQERIGYHVLSLVNHLGSFVPDADPADLPRIEQTIPNQERAAKICIVSAIMVTGIIAQQTGLAHAVETYLNPAMH